MKTFHSLASLFWASAASMIVLLGASGCSGRSKQATAREATREAIRLMAEQYPQATLQDVYKSFYQNRFGPGHMIADKAAFAAWSHQELEMAAADTIENPYYEMLGADGHYVRVYLRCVNEGLLPEETLMQAFLRSAEEYKAPEAATPWADEWQEIAFAGREMGVPCADSVLTELNEAAKLERAVHHSREYHNAYHPHYRVIAREIFDKEIRPLIEQKK